MVLFLSQPELSVGVFQGMLQGILGKRKAKRPNKPYGTEWRRVKILACRNCRTPFSSTSTHPIQKVNGLDGEPYPNCYHVKEGSMWTGTMMKTYTQTGKMKTHIIGAVMKTTYWSSDTEDTDWSSDSSSDTEDTDWNNDEDIHLDVGHFILNAV
ncbi:hypothetical protein CK203_047164 [Vitis vinifera]|uniref:Uncharacterized protein n=1 Tax=Vitis vinifera TaxID=29760 RepID=A0A438GSP3_VITVI|nr:hypothetical protein CK203_047164 [Vitis vinifera]